MEWILAQTDAGSCLNGQHIRAETIELGCCIEVELERQPSGVVARAYESFDVESLRLARRYRADGFFSHFETVEDVWDAVHDRSQSVTAPLSFRDKPTLIP